MRAHAFNTAHRNLDETIRIAQSVVTQLEIARSVEVRLQAGSDGDFDGYFETMAELEAAIFSFRDNCGYSSCEGALQRAETLLTSAMTRLVQEFREGLADDSLAPDAAALLALLSETSPKPPKILPLLPPENVPLLGAMAKKLLSGIFAQQGLQAYADVRKGRILATLKQLGMAKLSTEEVHRMGWEVAKGVIEGWTCQMRIAVTVLLPSEKKLCDQVFGDLGLDCSPVFCEVTAEAMATLLGFGDAVARGRRSPENLFPLLDMYKTLQSLGPEVDVTFGGKACADIRRAMREQQPRLAAAARGAFDGFVAGVANDGSIETVGDGHVSGLTKHVVHNVIHMMGYQPVLSELLGEGDLDATQSQLGVAVLRIFGVLRENLNAKKAACKHPALAELFMMNNLHYVRFNVERSEVRDLLDPNWIPRLRKDVQRHSVAYQRSSWREVTSLLTSEGIQTGGPEGPVNLKLVKDRFKALNAAIEELGSTQSQWAVPDLDGIRADLRLRVAEVLLPAYRSFLGRFGARLEAGKHPGNYIKYTPEDLERKFEGEKRNRWAH